MLEPVRASFRTDKSIEWIKVHDLPDFVYFNHSIHVRQGRRLRHLSRARRSDEPDVAGDRRCRWSGASTATAIRSSTSGRATRSSTWTWQPPTDQLTLGRELVKEYKIQVQQLTNCSICHR